eukprot:COSAG02_NODE_9485_length_2203_cov_2.793726_5_plen_27_part_01
MRTPAGARARARGSRQLQAAGSGLSDY